MQQDVRVLQLGDHLVGVGDEVWRKVAAVELHALDDVEFDRHAFGLFDRDDALVADPLHGARQHVADLALAVGGDGADLGDLRGGRDLPGPCLDVRDGCFDRHVDAALEVHRVHAGGTALTPSRTMAWASTVAVVVPSPASVLVLLATSRTIWAPMFSK